MGRTKLWRKGETSHGGQVKEEWICVVGRALHEALDRLSPLSSCCPSSPWSVAQLTEPCDNYTSSHSTSPSAKVQSQDSTGFLWKFLETPLAVSWLGAADVQLLHCSAGKEYSDLLSSWSLLICGCYWSP